jgi:hypothetical protein
MRFVGQCVHMTPQEPVWQLSFGLDGLQGSTHWPSAGLSEVLDSHHVIGSHREAAKGVRPTRSTTDLLLAPCSFSSVARGRSASDDAYVELRHSSSYGVYKRVDFSECSNND